MVDVSDKETTLRKARAESQVRLAPETLSLIARGALPKGNALETARLAGILAAKRTASLIPLCHPLPLTHVDVDAEIGRRRIRFVSEASCTGRTGVEMEAMVAAAVAALTLYDMVKAVEAGASIEKVRLLKKTGGKSDFQTKG